MNKGKYFLKFHSKMNLNVLKLENLKLMQLELVQKVYHLHIRAKMQK